MGRAASTGVRGSGGRGRRPLAARRASWAAGRAGSSSPTSLCERPPGRPPGRAGRAAVGRPPARLVVGVAQRRRLAPAPAPHRGRARRRRGAALGGRLVPAAAAAGRGHRPRTARRRPSTTAEAAAGAGDVGAGRGGRRGRRVDRVPEGFLTDDCDWVDRQRDLVRDLRVRAALALSAAHLARRRRRRGRSRPPATRSPSTRRARPPTGSSCERWPPPASGARRCGCGSAAASRSSRSSASTRHPRPRRCTSRSSAPVPRPRRARHHRAAVRRRHVSAHRHRRVVGAVGQGARPRWRLALERHDALVAEVVAAPRRHVAQVEARR